MLKEFLEFIFNKTKPETVKVNDFEYTREGLQLVKPPYAKAIQIQSLSSLVDYCKENTDELEQKATIINVIEPDKVKVFSTLDDYSERENYLDCNCSFKPFNFNSYYEHEEFVIALQSLFKSTEHLTKLKEVALGVTDVNETKIEDDTVTQNVTAKIGVATQKKLDVPNPVTLAPYRTFSEIDPVETQFVFRLKKGLQGQILCALFEADGGKWKEETMTRIKVYLKKEAGNKFTVI